jgi:Zn-dependent M16 (insulinase) family peptidase
MSNQNLSIGDELNGFSLVEINKLTEYSGIGYLFKHIATGLEVYHVANDDKELFFSYIFNTIPSNNSGVAHIIEHSVLAGSKKYPLRDPFIAIQKGSANTFMNAMTFPTKTLYPVASPLEKDFDNIFKVYTDAVFAPLLREETFMQEGIRLNSDSDGAYSFKGVVFNEMLGDQNDAEYQTNSSCIRLLYPDTPYSYNSGGEPLDIVDLNYQKFKAFYDQYYHPTNGKLFLYGELEITKYLNILDKEYLKSFAKINISPSKLTADRWDEPRKTTIKVPSSDEVPGSTVALAFATTDSSDSLEVITLAFIYELLLGSNGCPLYKKMIDKEMGSDVSNISGISSDYNLMPLIIAFSDVKEKYKGEDVEKFLMTSLTEIANSGFDEELVGATLKRLTFQIHEKPERGPMGMIALRRALRGWLRDKAPVSTIEYSRSVELLNQKMSENPNYLTDWMKDNIINNSHRLLLIAEADEKSVDNYQAQLAKKLTDRTDGFTEDMKAQCKAETIKINKFLLKGDSPESLKTIPKLCIADLPEKIRNIEHKTVIDLQVPIHKAVMETNQIVYFNYAIHVEDFSQRELMLLPLYTKIIESCSVADMDKTKVMTEIMNNAGGFSFALEGGSDSNGKRVTCFFGRVKMLELDLEGSLVLTRKIIQESHVDDHKDIWESIVSFRELYRSIASNYGYRFASLSAASIFSESGKVMEETVGVSQWLFLNSIQREDVSKIAKELKAIQQKLFNRRRYEIHLTCEKNEMAIAMKSVHTFLKAFPLKEEIVNNSIEYNLPVGEFNNKSVYLLPASVNHTSYVIPGSQLGTKENSVERVLSSILTGGDLWNTIRVHGGAYGVDCHVDSLERLFIFISGSDPNLASTFEAFKNSLIHYSTLDVKQEEINDAIISNVANDLRPFGPSNSAIIDFRRILFKISDDLRKVAREYILEVTSEDVNKIATVLRNADKRSSVIVADPSSLERDKEKMGFEEARITKLPI